MADMDDGSSQKREILFRDSPVRAQNGGFMIEKERREANGHT
jgi:hypothetical protein